jgi:hypothetical protein
MGDGALGWRKVDTYSAHTVVGGESSGCEYKLEEDCRGNHSDYVCVIGFVSLLLAGRYVELTRVVMGDQGYQVGD